MRAMGLGVAPFLVATFGGIEETASHRMNTPLLFRLGSGFIVAMLGCLNLFAADSGVVLKQSQTQLRLTWPISAAETGVAVFSLDETKPLIESLGLAAQGQPATVGMQALN